MLLYKYMFSLILKLLLLLILVFMNPLNKECYFYCKYGFINKLIASMETLMSVNKLYYSSLC